MPETGDLRASLASAKRALAEARWDDALDLLDGCEAWPIEVAEHAVLVKADTLTRRDAGNALAWLSSTDDIVASDEARFQREILTGRAYANARNFDSAAARFERARRYADHVADGPARLAYHLARMRWFRRTGSADGPDVALALTIPDPTGRAAALAIRGWLHASSGNFALQIADFRAALDIVVSSDHACDVGTVSSIVHALARVAFETADQDGVEAARRAYEYLRWTECTRVDRFQTVRILGMDAYVRGDIVRAQWLFRDAILFAPSPAWEALAHLDRALVAQFAGNDPWALDEIETAAKLAHGVPWGEMFGEERFALVGLAVMLAPIDIARSQRFAATFSRVGLQNLAPIYSITSDVRAVGYEKYAFGKIDQTLGNRDTATSSLVEAYNVFAIINYHFQAMLCAKALAEVTGDEMWIERARGHVAHYPGSPLMRDGEPIVKKRDPVVEGLTPFQMRLARAHWAGLDVAQLSRQFSRSAYTIEHQVQAIYEAFNVRSATGLREVAQERGLLA
jgi:tetratricopeptide (TPR) repeat protein